MCCKTKCAPVLLVVLVFYLTGSARPRAWPADTLTQESDVVPVGSLSPFSNPAEVQAALASMSEEQRADLQRKHQRFEGLKPAEQARLRRLHADLTKEQDRDHLHDLLARYQQWLKTLSAAQRADLSGLDAAERIQRIRELRAEQERRRFVELSDESQIAPQDAEAVMQWLNDYLRNHAEELLEQIPAEHRRFLADPRRRGRAISYLVSRGKVDVPSPTNEEFEALIRQVTSQMAIRLGGIDPASRAELVRGWLRRRALSAVPPRPQVSREELAIFFREELTEDERERIERLPADEMQDALRRELFRKRFPRGGPGDARPPRGGWRGDRRGGDDRGPPPGPEWGAPGEGRRRPPPPPPPD